MSNRARIAIVVIAAIGLMIAFFSAKSENGDQTANPPAQPTVTAPATTTTAPPTTTAVPAEPAVETITVEDGEPRGGVAKLRFSKGDRVRFIVESDVADEVHVHGYDVRREVAPGRAATFSFAATIEGRFEVELENSHKQVAALEVRP